MPVRPALREAACPRAQLCMCKFLWRILVLQHLGVAAVPARSLLPAGSQLVPEEMLTATALRCQLPGVFVFLGELNKVINKYWA